MKSFKKFVNESLFRSYNNKFIINAIKNVTKETYIPVNKRWGWILQPFDEKMPKITYYGGNDPVVKTLRIDNESYSVDYKIDRLFRKKFKELSQGVNESSETIMSQEEMSDLFIPIIQTEGDEYRKTGRVEAVEAKPGEHLVTNTSDGKETENTAKKGDWKIKNIDTSGEEYFISGDKFKQRYTYSGDDNIYLPTGECQAVQLSTSLLEKLNLPSTFKFEAPWGEDMIAKKGDFLATTDGKEVYRIAEKEFYESYSLKMFEHSDLVRECVPGTPYNHFLFSEEPLIFKQTLYDNVEDYHLGEIEYFRGLKDNNYSADKILKGLTYTTVGRGVMSNDNKEKIIKLAERLVNKFPGVETYKEVLNQAKKIKPRFK